MNSKFKIFDTIVEWQAAELDSNVVSLIREDNSIRYSGGYATYPDASTITKILRINNQDITPDSDGRIDIGEVITQHQDISHLASKNELANKQDVIDDLIDIRENSELAETSVQKIIANNIEYNALNGEIDLGSIVTSVKTINGQSIEGSGDITISSEDSSSQGPKIHIYNMASTNPEEEFQNLVNAFESSSFIVLGEEYNENLTPVYVGLMQPYGSDDNGQITSFIYYITTGIKSDEMGIANPVVQTMTIIISSTGITEDGAQFTIETTGDGSKFLSNNGTYSSPIYVFDPDKEASVLYSELGELVDGNTPMFAPIETADGVKNGIYFAPAHIMFYSDRNLYRVYVYGIASDFDEDSQSGVDWHITNIFNVTSSEVTFIGRNSFRADLFAKTSDLAAVATTGSYDDLTDKPTIPLEVTETTVSDWGFTKNTGTITGINVNGTSVATSGIANVETVCLCTSFTEGNLLTCCNSNTAFTVSAEDAAYINNTGNKVVARVSDSYGVMSGIVVGFSASTDSYLFLIGSQAYAMRGTYNTDSTITFTSGTVKDIANVPTVSQVNAKQDTLVSGDNIKTINGESILGSGDLTIEGGSGLPYYIVQSFTIDTILSAGTNNGYIQVEKEDANGIYNAVAEGKVILIPKNPDEGFKGYTIASGFAEDLAYLTFTCDNQYFRLDSSGFFNIATIPFVPDGAELGVVYMESYFSVDFFMNICDSVGDTQIQDVDAYVKLTNAVVKGYRILIPAVNGDYIPFLAESDGESIWYNFICNGELYSGMFEPDVGTCVISCVKGYNQGVRDLDSQTDTHYLLPFVTNRLQMDTTMQYQVEFLNPTGASNPEWKMQIDCWNDGVAPISFPSTVVWANENTPTFEIDYIYELSFTQFVDTSGTVYYLGVWSKWLM